MPPQMQRKSGGIPESSEREPRESDAQAFARLFHDAYRKCFSIPFTAPLTESESHHLSVDIAESTGLEIGWKSLKNYSSYLLGSGSRTENPSVPTLDTLARYVAGATPTDEERRRTRERHYPYWFRYRDALRQTDAHRGPRERDEMRATSHEVSEAGPVPARARPRMFIVICVLAAVALTALWYVAVREASQRSARFTDDFDDVSAKALASRGWSLQAIDSAHWSRRGVKPGHLTLFTLPGDNWPQPGRAPIIRNLLVRRARHECFVAEVQLTSFFPRRNWQQAGILLLEDTTFAGRSVRMSIGFNDFSGGFPQTEEIIIQAITSLGQASSKPEEFVHHRLFVVEPATEPLVRRNLESTALRIEKRGAHLRLLYSAGSMKNAPFKEVGSTDFDFRSAYVAVFALEGFVPTLGDAPAHLDAFSLSERSCS